jgi:hypothetical protein
MRDLPAPTLPLAGLIGRVSAQPPATAKVDEQSARIPGGSLLGPLRLAGLATTYDHRRQISVGDGTLGASPDQDHQFVRPNDQGSDRTPNISPSDRETFPSAGQRTLRTQ